MFKPLDERFLKSNIRAPQYPRSVAALDKRNYALQNLSGVQNAIPVLSYLEYNVLKSGCHVEALHLGAIERLERAQVLLLVVAWRIVHRMHTGRSRPESGTDWKEVHVEAKEQRSHLPSAHTSRSIQSHPATSWLRAWPTMPFDRLNTVWRIKLAGYSARGRGRHGLTYAR